MKSQTSLAARNCRLQEWSQMVHSCNNRPIGMSVNEWCRENSITTANYYYRMTQVRKACLDSLSDEAVNQEVVPVPMNLVAPAEESCIKKLLPESVKGSSLEFDFHGATLRVTDQTSDALLAKVLGVLAMLNNAICFKQIFIVTGYTDLRSGIDRLAALITSKTGDNPFVPDTLYLFCGRKTDRIKGLTWERDGFLLLYKRLEKGRFQWPRNESEVQSLTEQQFRWLMEGLTITPKHTVQEITPPQYPA